MLAAWHRADMPATSGHSLLYLLQRSSHQYGCLNTCWVVGVVASTLPAALLEANCRGSCCFRALAGAASCAACEHTVPSCRHMHRIACLSQLARLSIECHGSNNGPSSDATSSTFGLCGMHRKHVCCVEAVTRHCAAVHACVSKVSMVARAPRWRKPVECGLMQAS
jgi:hypothetical protein